jgi:hypothetical protein
VRKAAETKAKAKRAKMVSLMEPPDGKKIQDGGNIRVMKPKFFTSKIQI